MATDAALPSTVEISVTTSANLKLKVKLSQKSGEVKNFFIQRKERPSGGNCK